MNKIKNLMVSYPMVSFIIILPFSLVVVFTVLDVIINLIIPFLIGLWLTSWIYALIVGFSIKKSMYEPFWFVRSNKF